VQDCFATHIQGVDVAVVEGVMGLFDGVGASDVASTAHIARLLQIPILFVIDCARISGSVAAIAHGYRSFDPHLQVAGVILNRVGSDRHLDILKEALASIQMPILGVFRRDDAIAIPDRHLGLVPTDELSDWTTVLARLADVGDRSFDWPNLQPLLAAPRGATLSKPAPVQTKPRVRIGIARDRAFNFYYADNLDSLVAQGAELVFWSPLGDRQLPDNIQGLYLGGGFPEVFAEELSSNTGMRQSIQHAIRSGMPTYAECGGMMYLCETIVDFQARSFPMVGILPTSAIMAKTLTLGYRKGQARQATPLLEVGTVVTGHEFHKSHLTNAPTESLFELQSYANPEQLMMEGWSSLGQETSQLNLHASYLHLHWGAVPQIAQRFVDRCRVGAHERLQSN
jgi:cobyrinic acid a,c-diamide synthase